MLPKESLEKINTRYTDIEHKETRNFIAVKLERPHPFLKEPMTVTTISGETKEIIPKEYLYFNIQNETQEITNIITEEQKDIIKAILNNPKSHAIEILIDRLFEIQRDYQNQSHIPEVNFLSAVTSTLLSYGLQEDFIHKAFNSNHTLEQIMIVIFHFYLFQVTFQTTKYLSQFIYKVSQNYKYLNSKDSN